MMRAVALCLIGLASFSSADESGTGHGKTWRLTELSGAPFAASAMLTFQDNGQITGRAPCNRFSTRLSEDTQFELGPILSTKMACPNLGAETEFFAALSAMTQSEVHGDTLVLRNAAGAEMVFKASE